MIFESCEVAKFSKIILTEQLKDPNSGTRQGHFNPVKNGPLFLVLENKEGGVGTFSAPPPLICKNML